MTDQLTLDFGKPPPRHHVYAMSWDGRVIAAIPMEDPDDWNVPFKFALLALYERDRMLAKTCRSADPYPLARSFWQT